MISIFLFQLPKHALWLASKLGWIGRRLINIQSLILVPIVLVLLLLPRMFDQMPSSTVIAPAENRQRIEQAKTQPATAPKSPRQDRVRYGQTGFVFPTNSHER